MSLLGPPPAYQSNCCLPKRGMYVMGGAKCTNKGLLVKVNTIILFSNYFLFLEIHIQSFTLCIIKKDT